MTITDETGYRQSGRWATDREYWTDRLADAPRPDTAVPFGANGFHDGGGRAPARRDLVLDAAALTPIVRRSGGGTAAVLLAALVAFAHRVTGDRDIVVALRQGGATTPVRAVAGPEWTFGRLVTRVGRDLRSARRHRYLTEFDAPWPDRWSLVAEQDSADDGFEESGPVLRVRLDDRDPGRWTVTAVGPADDIARRYLILLEQLAREPERPIGSFDVTDATERRWATVTVNETSHPLPVSDTVAAAFARQADRTPHAVALVTGDATVEYGELAARVHRLARWLVAAGVGPETTVAVALPRSVDLVVALYAVAAAGAVYVPIDPDHPAVRTAHMLDTVRPLCVLTRSADEIAVPAGVRVVAVDTLDTSSYSPAPLEDSDRRAPVRPEHAAYVIFTSGSTGVPKGVAVSQVAIVNHLEWMIAHYALGPDEVYLQKTATTFDVSLWGFLLPLRVGATVVLARPGGRRDPEYLAELIDRHGVTVTDFVPSLLSAFVREVDAARLRSLRQLFVIGEQLPPAVAAAVGSAVAVHNVYGPTEAAIAVTAHRAEPGDTPVVPIGGPGWNMRAYVLDSGLRPAPAGFLGELYLAGIPLARGYYGRAAATAERFVADPYGPAGTRMYRTGDLVRRRPDGTLEFGGRADSQVKLRGQRIELGEVEQTLATHPDIERAVVLVRGGRLVAYTIAAQDLSTTAARTWLADRLPTYMLPDALVRLDRIPMATSGKLDVRALPAPADDRPDYRAPAGPAETVVAASFADVLGLEEVGAHDSFFALGGDSIMAILLVARARGRGVRFTAQDVFEQRTVAALAALADITPTDADTATLAELPGGGVGDLPLPPVLRYLLDRGVDDGPTQSAVLRLPADVDHATLVATLAAVVDRHDMFRARLFREAGEWRLTVAPPGAVDVAALVRRVAMEPGADTETVRATLAAEQAAALRRLAPAEGIVLQAVWLDRPGAAGWLLLVVHHVAVDAVSWRVVVPDLMSAWTQLRSGRPAALPAPATSMRRWAHALAEEARRAERVAELPLWQEIVDAPETPLGTRAFDAAVDRARDVRQVRVEVDQAQTADLEFVGGRFRADTQEVLLTALALALAAWRPEAAARHRVWLEGHGREAVPGAELSRTVGWFTTVYPALLDVSDLDTADALAGGPAAGAALKRVKEQLRELPDRGVGYGLLRYLNPETADALAVPAAEVGFRYLGRTSALTGDAPWLPDPDLSDLPEPVVDAPATAGLDVATVIAGDRLHAVFAYPRTLLSDNDVKELSEYWQRALAGLRRHGIAPGAGGRTPSDFPLVRVSQGDIESWERRYPGLVDVWPLAPLQEGLYFHAVLAQSSVDAYHVQTVFRLAGVVDTDRLLDAVRGLLERHTALRVAVTPAADGTAVQIVAGAVRVPWSELDLRDTADPAAEFAAFAAEDRRRPFRLDAPPLLRCALLTLGDNDFRLVVTTHHLLMDGWSMPLVAAELLTRYAAGELPDLPPPRGYQHFLAWLRRQDRDRARLAWRAAFEHATEPTLLAPEQRVRHLAAVADTVEFGLDEEHTARLRKVAAAQQVTANTVLQCAWGLTLARTMGRRDVVFGTAVSGRPADLAGVADMVGLFVNTVPVRVRVAAAETVAELLVRHQREQAELVAHQYLGLADILAAAGRPALFDTLLEVQSYPLDAAALTAVDGSGLAVTDVEVNDGTHYPLTLVAWLDTRLRVKAGYLRECFDESAIRELTGRWMSVLSAMLDDPDAPIDRLVPVEVAEKPAAPGDSAVPRPRPYSPPRGPLEEAVAAAYAEALDLPRAGRDDDFFALGGDSLSAMRVVTLLRARAGADVPIGEIFAAPTVAALAARVRPGPRERGVAPMPRPERIPLSHGQRRLWLVHELSDGAPMYNIPLALRLTGPVDIEAMRAALRDVVIRHESLRTVCAVAGGEAYQRISDPAEVDLELPVIESGAAGLSARLGAAARRRFDLAADLPIRAAVMRCGPEEHVLIVVLHHIAADGWSLVPLARDVATAYTARCGGSAPAWDPLPVQYADYTLWQRERLGADDEPTPLLRGQLEYWRTELANLPQPLALPTDRPRPAIARGGGDHVALTVEADLLAAVEAYAADRRATTSMVLQAALIVLLHRWGGGTDITVGGPIAGRNDPALTDLVGFFVNTWVLRVQVSGDLAFATVVDRVRAKALAAYDHQDAPFERLVDLLAPQRSTAYHPLYQVMFAWQNTAVPELTLPGLRVEPVPVGTGTAKADLFFGLTAPAAGQPAVGSIEYATDLFDRDTVRELAAQYSRLLAALIRHPDLPLSTLDTVPAEVPAGPAHPSAASELTETRESAAALSGPESWLPGGAAVPSAGSAREVPARSETVAPPADLGPEVPDARGRVRPLTAAQREIWFGQQLDRSGRRFVVGGYLHIRGDLDHELFEQALRHTVAGAETLRVRIAIGPDGPVQVVEELAEWPLCRKDFRDSAEPFDAARAFVAAELDRPYDLTTAPLFDHALLRVGDADHLWFIRFHHLVGDGGGMAAFTRRVSDTYSALRAGDTLADAVFDRLDAFVDQDVRYRASHRYHSDREFWAGRLAGLGEAPVLAEDATQGGADEFLRHTGTLDAGTWQALRRRADEYGVRWPVLVLTATALALHADTGSRVVVPGLTVPAKRSWHALGMTANVVPLRVAVDPRAPLSDLVAAVSAESSAVLRHQHYRHADMRRAGLVDGRPPYGPVATIMPMDLMREFGGNPAVPHQGSPGRTDGVTLGVYDNGEPELRLDLDSVTARHTPANLAAHHSRLLTILSALATADADTPVGRLRFGGESTRLGSSRLDGAHAPVAAGLQGGENRSEPNTLVEWLRRGTSGSGAATAVVHGAEEITYRELDERSERWAARLAALGAGPGMLVAVSLPRGTDLVVALAAILRSGAAYVPLDPANPAARLRMILDDCRPELVITTRDHAAALEGERTLLIEALDEPDPQQENTIRPRPPRPDDPAYVIHTSGSTGRPKGVVVTHRCAARLLASTRALLDLGPADVWTLFHSVAFDFSVWELWGALGHGATLVIVDERTARSPDDFLELLVARRVTVLNQTPAAFELLTAAAAARPGRAAESALRLVILGGDKTDPRRLASWTAAVGSRGPRLVNMYGITETTVHATAYELPAEGATGPESVVGHPLPGRNAVLLDAALREVPPGLPGEIYLGGDGVANGYLRRPGLTAARFVADPAGPPGARRYRSGDLGRLGPRGLEYLGRADRQVKIRGFRIEPGEVEAALCALPEVTAAVVRAEERAPGDRRLVAYAVAPGGDPGALRDRLTALLPAHAVPSLVVPIDALPLTANGKIDHAALSALRAKAGARGGRPAGELANAVYDLFADTLGRTDFDSADDFFALGGDSLLAGRLVLRIRAELGADIDIRDLFDHPTVAALADLIEHAKTTAPQRLPLGGPRPDRIPLSAAQQRLWTLHRLDPSSVAYHIPVAVELTGALDVDALRAALTDLRDRHESLRTVFTESGDAQRIHPDPPHPMSIDTGEPTPERLAAAAARPFDPCARPPWRVTVFTGGTSTVLLLVLHHLIADEHSLGVLAADLGTAYSARRGGRAPAWPPLPVQYADYVVWQQGTLGTPDDPHPALAAELTRWRHALRDLPDRLPLPIDRAATSVTQRGDTVALEFDPGIRDRIAALAAARCATPFMVLHAAVACLLGRAGGGTDIVVGTVTSGRDTLGLDDLIGFFAETVVLRTDLSGRPGFAAVVDRARDTDLAAFAQPVPFDRVVAAVRPERVPGRHPLFEVMVTLRPDRIAVDLAGVRCRPLDLPRTHAKFPLLFEFAWGTGTVGGVLEYSADLFERTTAESLAGGLRRLLAAALAEPDRPVDELPFLSGGERLPAAPSAPLVPTAAAAADPAIEHLLLELARSVLGVPDLGVHDSFFRFGGDSILAIRLVNRARGSGVSLTPTDVFERQTVRELARVATAVAAPADPLAGVGPVHPTPIMRELLDNPTPTDGFGQYVVVPAPDDATAESLGAALQRILDRHDALRLVVHDGRELEVRPPGAVTAANLLRHSVVDDAEAALATALDEARARLRPSDGVLLQAVWLDARPGLLLLVVHHLAIDGVSWRILVPELAAAHRAVTTGVEPAFAPIVTPLRTWAAALAERPVPAAEARWWSRTVAQDATGRAPDPSRDTVGAAETHTVTIGSGHTAELLTRVPHRFRGTVADILLAALSVAARRATPGDTWPGVLVDVEGHGRDLTDPSLAALDVSTTLGWFTVVYPVRLTAAVPDWDAMVDNGSGLGDAANTVKEAVRSTPRRGVGYGLLRHGADVPPEIAAARVPIGFNYLGRLGGDAGTLGVRFGSTADPGMALPHALEINAVVAETPAGPVLRAEWTWAPSVVDAATVQQMAGDWAAVLASFATHHTDPAGVERTPSDFPLAEVTAAELSRLRANFGEPSDLLPATPLQAGLLFHTLYQRAAEAPEDAYVVQLVLGLEGELDEQRLRAATVALLRRHPHLGCVFAVEGADRIVAVVREGVEPDWRTVDSTSLPEPERERFLTDTLRAERRRIDPAAAPPLAFCLVRTGPQEWRLAFTHHHVLLDGWSVANVLRETILLYLGADLPPAPPFRDYLRWRAGRDRDAARAAWQAELRDCRPTRVSRAGRAGWSEQPEVHEFVLPDALAERLPQRAAAAGLTLNTLVSAAWALVLAHLTGSDDVVFGTTVAVRPADLDAERMVGLMINTVPVRVRLRPGDTLAALAAGLQATRAALYEHDHLGLHEIEEVAGSAELFDTSVVFENYPVQVDDLGDAGLRARMVDVFDRPHYPVALVVVPGAERTVFRLAVRPRQLDWFGTPEQWWERFRAACAALTDAPERTVAATDLLPPAERRRMLEWGVGSRGDVGNHCLAAVFEETATRHADRVAIRSEGAELTFAEVRARVRRVSGYLARLGVGPGSAVGVTLDRSAEVAVAFLAVVRLGALIVPLDQRFPAERRRNMLRHSGAEVILDAAAMTAADEAPEGDVLPLVPVDTPACLMFTSGSTGVPKGVVVTQRNILARVRELARSGGVADRILFHSPHSWDFAVHELWLPLLTGRCLVVAPAGDADPAEYGRILREGGVTTASVASGLFEVLSEHHAAELARLRLIVAGSALAPAAVARVRAVRPDAIVVNGFGPVEATFIALAHDVSRVDADGPVPIGRPIENSSVFVLDSMLRPVPPMVVGEIYLAGQGLADGYHRVPGATADRFVACPFGPPGARMYRTGDLGRWDRQGVMHFHGRSDRQVKVGGFRVEPGEVEAALRRRPAVAAAVVTARTGTGGTALVAYVVARTPVDPVRLRAELLDELPRYLVPAVVVEIPALPLTPTGKVDFDALPPPPRADGRAARSPRQRILAELFAAALGVAEVGIDDDLFALGGNSLSAMRLVGRIRSALGGPVSLRDLFEAPTVAGMERHLGTRAAGPSRTVASPMTRPAVLPLSPAQQRFWTVNYLGGQRADYLLAAAVEVRGDLDTAALRAAVGDLVARHESLRTVLPYTENGPVQQIVAAESVRIGLPALDIEAGELDGALAREVERGFDLRSQLPLRGKLFRLAPDRHVLFAMMHHAAVDGESLAVLRRDLAVAYAARQQGSAPEWPTPAGQYADHVLALRARLGDESEPGSVLHAQSRYWRAKLADLPEELSLPYARPRTELTGRTAATVPVVLDAAAVARVARACAATPYAVVHTALAAALSATGAGRDVPIGVAVSGRDSEELDTVVGCLIDLVIVRVDTVAGGHALVRAVRDDLLTAVDNRDYPFDRMVEQVNPRRVAHRHPLIQVATSYRVETVAPELFPDASTYPLPTPTTEFDLLLELTERATPGEPVTISGTLTYPEQLFERHTIEALAATLRGHLADLESDCD
ncbi:non-ribosomal peptide synthetase [Nocardia blacklockiae]|uniref:non-ribosomal peptide synthetase n=1 Tax=Nocardia blacklockiae TaxID=480036 RepID=UPI0018948714|nr:non-ribosomal peptide synthetase [Nocardia blacklockiae]MBF6175770.1 amino acid adenylation domain-containing protein [Nocardia blacklockiae]